MIVIPPVSQLGPDPITQLPSCFDDYPTAVINYRWQAPEGDSLPETPLHWPTPVHDVSFGYAWIMANLGSDTALSNEPRPAYVYGSYLGASLAASLALTEARIPEHGQSMTIRGLIAHNGVYNWTMFLPDHPIRKLKLKSKSKSAKKKTKALELPLSLPLEEDDPIPFEEEGIFAELKNYAPEIFSDPSNLFDPFASPCLFFHSPDLYVPDDFTTPLFGANSLSSEFTAAVDQLSNSSSAGETSNAPSGEAAKEGKEEDEEESAEELLTRATILAKQLKPPRKSYLFFPPRDSGLRIPHSLFLYDRPHEYSPPAAASSPKKQRGTPLLQSRNNFGLQATELMGLMMRSIDMHELKQLSGSAPPWQWEGEIEDGDSLAEREYARSQEIQKRVQSFEVEPPDLKAEGGGHGLGLEQEAVEVVAEWLRERIDEDFGDE